MPSVRLNVEVRDKLLSSAAELFGALGVELTSEQQAETADRQAYRARRAQQKREHYEAHRGEILERQKARAVERKEEIRTYQAAYRARNKAKAQAYREAHREEARERARVYYAKKRWDEGAATFPKTSPPVGEQSSIQRPAVIDQRGEVEARR